jgi:hypothetical protein
MTGRAFLRTMCVVRNLVIAATVAIGALRIMWRALNSADRLGSVEEWTADE